MTTSSISRVRWAAIGAAVAISLGAGSVGIVNATKGSGERPVATSINPCRLADTRPASNVGPRATPLGTDDTHTINVTGNNGQCAGIPGDVTAVELNVTAIGATRTTYLTIWPGGPRPNASSLNPAPGQPPTPNAVTVKLANNGSSRCTTCKATSTSPSTSSRSTNTTTTTTATTPKARSTT